MTYETFRACASYCNNSGFFFVVVVTRLKFQFRLLNREYDPLNSAQKFSILRAGVGESYFSHDLLLPLKKKKKISNHLWPFFFLIRKCTISCWKNLFLSLFRLEGFTRLFCLAVHQIGHSLGLFHSRTKHAYMWPFLKDCNRTSMTPDHIEALHFLYGEYTSYGEYSFGIDT